MKKASLVNLLNWTRFGFRRAGRKTQRLVTLDGLPPFLFETHGHSDIYISYSIISGGVWEQTTTRLLLELLGNDADLVDVGANIGWHSVVAGHRLGDRGRVHSFEPEPRNLAKLRTNVALSSLGNVVVNGWALSDGSRADMLSLSEDNLGDHRLGARRAGRDAVSVAVRRLDDYAGIRSRPLVVKLDVQGSEWHVLRGARKLLASHPHEIVLLCEMSPMMLRECGASVDGLCGLLVEGGFLAAVIDQRTGSIEPVEWERLRERLAARERDEPDCSEDIVAFRRRDGLMGSLLTRAP